MLYIYIYIYIYINQFPADNIKSMWQFKSIYAKCVDKECLYFLIKYGLTKKCSPNTHTHTHTHTHIYIYIYI